MYECTRENICRQVNAESQKPILQQNLSFLDKLITDTDEGCKIIWRNRDDILTSLGSSTTFIIPDKSTELSKLNWLSDALKIKYNSDNLLHAIESIESYSITNN